MVPHFRNISLLSQSSQVQEELSQENVREGLLKYFTAHSFLLFGADGNTNLCGMAHTLLC